MPKLPRYIDGRGWRGGDSRTLHAYTDTSRDSARCAAPMTADPALLERYHLNRALHAIHRITAHLPRSVGGLSDLADDLGEIADMLEGIPRGEPGDRQRIYVLR